MMKSYSNCVMAKKTARESESMPKIAIYELVIGTNDFDVWDVVKTHKEALHLLFDMTIPRELIYISVDGCDEMPVLSYLMLHHSDQIYWRIATTLADSSKFNLRDVHHRMQNMRGNKQTVRPSEPDLVLLVIWEAGGMTEEVPYLYSDVQYLWDKQMGRVE